MDKNNIHGFGFTLIELLIVIVITMVLSGLMLASYNSYTESKKLDSEASKLIDILTVARNKASAGDTLGYNDCGGGAFAGYKVTINPASYTFSLICLTRHDIQTVELQKGISASVTAGSSPFTFNPLTVGLTTKTTIKLKDDKMPTNNCILINISVPGIIDQGSNFSC